MEKGMSNPRSYFVYWIQSGARAYIGATVDPRKRLRQHNGEIAGGAAKTQNRGPWHFHCVVSGFRTWKEALQYEWAAKYYTRRCRGIAARREALCELGKRERWTSNSPPARDVPLTFDYNPSHYGGPPEHYAPRIVKPMKRASKKGKANKATRPFKKKLHNVTY